MLLPARDIRSLPFRLADLVESRLNQLGFDIRAIKEERGAMAPVEVAPSADRSVVGIMVDFAKSVPYYLKDGYCSDSTLRYIEGRLSETPCHAGRSFDRVIFPKKKAAELLRLKWLDNTARPVADCTSEGDQE
jgi:hypothetical protein